METLDPEARKTPGEADTGAMEGRGQAELRTKAPRQEQLAVEEWLPGKRSKSQEVRGGPAGPGEQVRKGTGADGGRKGSH